MGGTHGRVLCVILVSAIARKCSEPGEDCRKTGCCTNALTTCYRKNKFWAGCKESCKPGLDPLDPPKDRTPWSCEVVTPDNDTEDGERSSDLPRLPVSFIPAGLVPPPPTPECDVGVTKGLLGISGLAAPTYAAGGGGKVRDPGLYLGHNSGYSILRSCSEEYRPESFALFRLLGGRVSFTIDLSRVGCACNVAFYLTGQPAKGKNGLFDPGPQGDYYCDANDVQTQWCPEIDIMEANNQVFAATAHKCDSPDQVGHYSDCDRSGLGENTRDIPGAYGPGSRFRINTEKPFTVTTVFASIEGATFTGMKTILHQDDREVVLEHGNCRPSYLAELSDAMSGGMAIRISYWGKKPKTMAWLDEPPCSPTAACNGTDAGFAVISGLSVKGSLAPPVHDPTPEPTEAPAPTSSERPWWAETTENPYWLMTPPPEPEPGDLTFVGVPTEPPAVPVGLPEQGPGFDARTSAGVTTGAARRTRRFHWTPKMALAAAIAALSGAFLLAAVVAPYCCQSTLPPGVMPPHGHAGAHPGYGGGFVGPSPDFSNFAGTPQGFAGGGFAGPPPGPPPGPQQGHGYSGYNAYGPYY